MRIGIELVRRGLISMEELFAAVEMQAESQPPIGQLAIRKRKMNMAQVFQVLAAQADENEPFGIIAKRMRFLTKRDIADLLLLQSEETLSIGACLMQSGVISQATLDEETTRFRAEFRTTEAPNSVARLETVA